MAQSTETPEQVFSSWRQAFEADPRQWSRFAIRYQWRLAGESGGAWLLDCGTQPKVSAGDYPDSEFEIQLSESDFLSLVKGELNPQSAFLHRRLRLRGKMKYVLRFNLLLEELIDVLAAKEAAALKRLTGGCESIVTDL